MAARGRPIGRRHQDDVRKKIQASQLINRLNDHVFGMVEMTATQLKAAEVLLKKSLPDLQSIDVTGELEHKHTLADVLGSLNKRAEDDSSVA